MTLSYVEYLTICHSPVSLQNRMNSVRLFVLYLIIVGLLSRKLTNIEPRFLIPFPFLGIPAYSVPFRSKPVSALTGTQRKPVEGIWRNTPHTKVYVHTCSHVEEGTDQPSDPKQVRDRRLRACKLQHARTHASASNKEATTTTRNIFAAALLYPSTKTN